MGYRSDTAYAIVTKTTEDRDKIINKITPDEWNLIKNEVKVEPTRILYHDAYVKWYSSTGLLGLIPGGGGFDHIDAHKALMDAAREAQEIHEYAEIDGNEDVLGEGIPNMGVFMRLGEDSDDFEREVWGEAAFEGAPEWYDLVDERRELSIGWE